ncbi:MAG: hypothetical protein ACRDWS_06795 [Acidimicrobiia bacterium]
MGQFQASLRLPGDSRALTATVQLHDGRLQVASGEHVIGDWPIDAIDISPIPEGIRVAAEGEVLLLDISDRAAFEQEAASQTTKPKRFSRSKQAVRPGTSQSAASSRAATSATVKVKTTKPRTESKLDVYLARAKERFGSNLPDWVFSRWGLAAVVGLLAFCVIFAEFVSNLLLITGVVVLLVGGVTMLDSVIARRILHHKVTPIQVVIGGGTIFVVGLLIGFVA